jgi:hypothetical protein
MFTTVTVGPDPEPDEPISLRCILHLRLGLEIFLFRSWFPAEILCVFLCLQCVLHFFLLYSVALVRERTTPTDRPPLVGEVSANLCG